MPSNPELLKQIESALGAYATAPLLDASLGLFRALGYRSELRMKLHSATAEGFLGIFDRGKTLNAERALLADWQAVEFLFQLTDSEVQSAITGTHELAFDSRGRFEGAEINSYLFLALELRPADSREGDRRGQAYSRTELAGATRALNRLFRMPVLLVFKQGDTLSLGIIHRRLSKHDPSKDVLEKVTLIKDIAFADPIRAHLEILNDFALANLAADFGVSNFVQLHEAWQKRLGSYALSNQFYREIADWYFWAQHQVQDGVIRLPVHCDTEQEQSLFLIRLLTRVIFSWFLVEKRLIPGDLFRPQRLQSLLKDFVPGKDPLKPDSSPSFYRAVLQNLFFGTLNMPPENRAFRQKAQRPGDYDLNYGITNLWRYEAAFRDRAQWEALAHRIPFLNGGLFDCLDDKSGKKKDNSILDGFSDRDDFGCHLPNDLFFGPERSMDLSRDYGEEDKRTARSKKAKVRGLIEILSRYKFTIEENTPLEEEIALDPELLGKVFENLLASYNEDTRTTARKALGAFYTPREIVSYMVDEALKSYLASQVPRCKGALEDLFSNKATLKEIKPDTRDALIAAIGRVKILDPACGSGAFPMGALHRLVDLLQKLDPNNESWKRDRLADARRYRALLESSNAKPDEIAACDARIADIEKSFDTRFHALDFARKLYLIENCIYGVDIQPIATQIAKLRFFISLVVDQKVDPASHNLGVRPLPNLETRLVAADTLIPIEKAETDLLTTDLDKLRAELAAIRHEHFNARSPAAKRKWRAADEAKRGDIAQLLERNHALPKDSARKLAAWDPYDQNRFAPFFDSQWMFGLPAGTASPKNDPNAPTDPATHPDQGFDIVIGNPPYVDVKGLPEGMSEIYFALFKTAKNRINVYALFIERSIQLLSHGGTLAFINPSSLLVGESYSRTRQLILPDLETIIKLPDATFLNAIVETMLLFVRRGSGSQKVNVAVYRNNEGIDFAALRMTRFEKHDWENDPNVRFSVFGSSNELRLCKTLDSQRQQLEDVCEFSLGLTPYDKYKGHSKELIDSRAFHAPNKIGPEYVPLIDGSSICRYAVLPVISEWLKYGPWLGAPRQDRFFNSARVIVRQIASGNPPSIFAGFTDKPLYHSQIGFAILANKHPRVTPGLVLCLLNSRLLNFYHAQRFLDREKVTFQKVLIANVRKLPVQIPSEMQLPPIERVTQILISLHGHSDGGQDPLPRDALMLAYWERVLNGLVYELYFPEEVHGAGLGMFWEVERAGIPDVTSLGEGDRLPVLRRKFEELHDGTHPLRLALDKLQTLETVRTIEGKA